MLEYKVQKPLQKLNIPNYLFSEKKKLSLLYATSSLGVKACKRKNRLTEQLLSLITKKFSG